MLPAMARPKYSIKVCVASVASISKLVRCQEWHSSARQKFLSGKAMTVSKQVHLAEEIVSHTTDKGDCKDHE